MTRPTIRDDLALIPGYHSPQVDVPVRLNTNESPTQPPTAWSEALAAELSTIEWNRYPDRAASALRAGIADQYDVDTSMVFAANGSNEILQSLLLAYGGPGRPAAVFEPTYALHAHVAKLTGTRVISGERDESFGVSPAELDRIFEERPDVLFLCSPNNPTGIAEPEALIRDVVDRAQSSGVLVVVDEAYGQFSPLSSIELVDHDCNVVVTRTFSKTWSMAGARLGYVIAPAWVVAALEAVALPYHLDVAKQVAGRLALQFVDEMHERVEQLVLERERMAAVLDDLAVTQWPSAANFILLRPERASADDVWQALLDRGVLVRNCASWPRLDGCLRVTVGTTEENNAFLGALAEILGS